MNIADRNYFEKEFYKISEILVESQGKSFVYKEDVVKANRSEIEIEIKNYHLALRVNEKTQQMIHKWI